MEPSEPLTPGPAWLQIWLEAGREGRIFTYSNPLRLPLASGDLVRLKLRGRRHIGLVVEGLEERPAELEPDRLQPVQGLLQSAAVDADWQALLGEVAIDCHTSLFKTLKTALPPGWLGQRPERQAGPARNRWLVELTPPPPSDGASSAFTPRQQALLTHLEHQGGRAWLSTLTTVERFSRSLVDGLERQGRLRRRAVAAGSAESVALQAAGLAHQGGTAQTMEPPQAPSEAQRQALERLAATPPGGALLLWGVTGSGKTEVYLQACALALAQGQSALVLTPEIGLVPQLLDRFKARFAGSIVEYHSGLSEAQRITSWRRCLEADRTQPVVVVGTRSAVFLPLRHLALIALDEEHDSSYKQDAPMPCYHARDVARHRARRSGARLLLGSATPSLETWLACRHNGPGATALVRLPERIGQRPLPPVRVIDMRQELADGHRHLLSRPLKQRLERVRERGEQAVVLVPRRGYSSFLSCRSCGEVVQCPHCDVALTVHRSVRSGDWLRCHWCDHRQDIEERCGACGSTAFKPFGAGTQRVMEQLTSELEGLRVLRFDRDTTRGQGGHRRLLEQFAAGEADVLVGTQMLAKGMDLPGVTLAAVLAADGLLHRPDLRSSEQSLQLLLQLAGRAGRGERPGEVLVQTYCPDHAVIRHLVDGRYELFLEQELEIRRQAGLVPFSRAALLRLVGVSASATATAATTLAERIAPQVKAAGWVMVGPAPAAITRVAGRSRWQLLLHGPSGSPLPLPPEAELRQGLPQGVGLAIDPDPLEL